MKRLKNVQIDRKISINQDTLKIIALITMIIDHLAKYFPSLPISEIGHYIGRISFPIFSFLLIYHLSQKQIYQKYITRLTFFGVLTLLLLFPFQTCFEFNTIFPLNIMFSFLIAVLALNNYEWVKKQNTGELIKKSFLVFNFSFFAFLSLFCQYDLFGFCLLIFLYFYFRNQNNLCLLGVLLFSALINPFQFKWIVSLITIFMLLCMDFHKSTHRFIKHWWIFYANYPVHLILLAVIKFWLNM